MGKQPRRHNTANTPCLVRLEEEAVTYSLHPYDHESDGGSYGLEAAAKLDVLADQIFKTLVISLDTGELAVCIIPVTVHLNLKSAAKAFGVKKASMADKTLVSNTTGYVLGGVSPIGQKRPLPTVIDESAILFETILVSAGMRGLDVELPVDELQRLTKASFEAVSM